MARAHEVSVQLDEVTLHLRFDFNAVATIEELTGRNVLEGLNTPSGRDLRAVVYACCAAWDESRGREPERSLKEVGALMNMASVAAITGKLPELLGANMPEPAEEPAEPAGEEEDPTAAPSR